ncbi:hypothetical protein RIF29_09621 [Crotalaria pallida]|uniref:Uncharacterized protein n=1 Tax=Crotalaria pallida TaxID=3830 RepID=A0AAN9FUK6_CROPI
MSHWLPTTSADGGHNNEVLEAQRSGRLTLTLQPEIAKKLLLEDLSHNSFPHNRKLRVFRGRGGVGTLPRANGRTSSAIKTQISVFHPALILCSSLLLGFFLL